MSKPKVTLVIAEMAVFEPYTKSYNMIKILINGDVLILNHRPDGGGGWIGYWEISENFTATVETGVSGGGELGYIINLFFDRQPYQTIYI